jgi:bacterioferritin
MKGNEQVVKKLDELLIDELTAIMQYTVHAEMCANWGYERLHQAVEKRARQEMRHAESLIARILFLEGVPTVSRLNELRIGADVPKQLDSDLKAEMRATGMYNAAIHVAHEANDAATRDLLESIVNDEDGHVDWIEEQLGQVEQLGVPLYLSMQTRA